MRNRFAKTCATLCAAMAATALGLPMAGAATTSAPKVWPDATPACGTSCILQSSLLLGTDTILNAYVPGDTGSGGKAGQPVVLQRASDTHPNQDFTASFLGRVSNYCGTSNGDRLAPSSYACRYLGRTFAVEEAWSPYGNDSRLCVGAAVGQGAGAKLTLQPCGESGRTLLIEDLLHLVFRNGQPYIPLISGTASTFSQPLVVTVDEGSKKPANQLVLQREKLQSGGGVEDSQLFGFARGPVS